MNHWPAEVTNLSELHLPLIEWTKQQVPSGERTAKAFYNARGWVTHILGNVWEFTAPGEHPSWGSHEYIRRMAMRAFVHALSVYIR